MEQTLNTPAGWKMLTHCQNSLLLLRLRTSSNAAGFYSAPLLMAMVAIVQIYRAHV